MLNASFSICEIYVAPSESIPAIINGTSAVIQVPSISCTHSSTTVNNEGASYTNPVNYFSLHTSRQTRENTSAIDGWSNSKVVDNSVPNSSLKIQLISVAPKESIPAAITEALVAISVPSISEIQETMRQHVFCVFKTVVDDAG